MSEPVNQLVSRLDATIGSMQKVAPEVWAQSVRAQVIEGWIGIGLIVLCLLAIVGDLLVLRWSIKNDRHALADFVGPASAIVGAFLLLLGIGAVVQLSDCVNAIVNPEACAAADWVARIKP
jgi:hypothetical protein